MSGTFIDAERARAAAHEALRSGPHVGDPAFGAWQRAEASSPLVVHDLSGRPSYWLVPVAVSGRSVGAIRVLGDGRVAALVAHRSGSDITAIDAPGALARVQTVTPLGPGETYGSTLLVHDGPHGREAWRVEILRAGRSTRFVFVTPGGIYERPAEAAP